ncbi:hypothetical protein [Lysobacter capsici]|uniref:hypothetical protein n=1 Tax=Lysobacter capsici TaxID=435897 RepID=UPI000AFA8C1C|nr:hypothetical protein [Lysobacter capsici]
MRLIDRWRIEQSRTIPALRRYRISVDKVRRMGVEQLSNRLNKKRLVIRRRHDSALDRRRHLFSGGKISTARYAIHDSIKPRALRRIAIDCSERKPTLRIPEGRSLEFSNFGHACFLTCRGCSMFKHVFKLSTLLVVGMSCCTSTGAAIVATPRYAGPVGVGEGNSGSATAWCDSGEVESGGGHSLMTPVKSLQIQYNGPKYQDGRQGWSLIFRIDAVASPGQAVDAVVHVICLKQQ